MTKIFIDGSAGTTGLRIRERLSARKDIELITLSEDVRKDLNARREALNAADIAFLCLPDQAAAEAVALIDNPNTAVIDTSTAHRTAAGWVYGMPELHGQRERLAAARRIANPGCHASGFIALVAPLAPLPRLSNRAVSSARSSLPCTVTAMSSRPEKAAADKNPASSASWAYFITGPR